MSTIRCVAVGVVIFLCACNEAPTAGGGVDAADVALDAATDAGPPSDDAMSACEPSESCDGIVDDDCDGSVDEGCAGCPVLAEPCSSGCCAVEQKTIANTTAFAPELAIDAAGNVFYAYTDATTSWKSVLAIRDAGTGTWRQVQLGAGSYRNRVRVDATGRVHVLAASNGLELYYRRSDDQGMTFTTPTIVGMVNGGGTYDLELDSGGSPHVAFAAKQSGTSLADLRYATFDGATWTSVVIDGATAQNVNPDLSLDAAGQPHIVTEGYNPAGVTGTTKRYHQRSGGSWSSENADIAPSAVGSYVGDRAFAAHSLAIAADGSRELMFMKSTNNLRQLWFARRGSSPSDAWQASPVLTSPGFETPVMFIDHNGKHGAVADGLHLLREQATWAVSPQPMMGASATIVRRGRYLFVGYIASTVPGTPTLAVVDLGP